MLVRRPAAVVVAGGRADRSSAAYGNGVASCWQVAGLGLSPQMTDSFCSAPEYGAWAVAAVVASAVVVVAVAVAAAGVALAGWPLAVHSA